jgi:hypothetical protein
LDNVYLYGHLEFPKHLLWSLGTSYKSFERGDSQISNFNPKIGLQMEINDTLRLHLAAFEEIKGPYVANQTIEPTSIASFAQILDDPNGTSSKNFAFAIDKSINPQIDIGFEFFYRSIDLPIFSLQNEDFREEYFKEKTYRTYLYGILSSRWSLNTSLEYEVFRRDFETGDTVDWPTLTRTLRIPAEMRFFDDGGLFSKIGLTYVYQDVERSEESLVPQGSDQFFLADAEIGYRFPKRRGIMTLEIRNIFNEAFSYQDDNFRNVEPRTLEFIPETTILSRLTLNF